MDLDGTLTQHKSKLDKSCRAVLEKLSQSYRLLVIGAGSCERIYRQLDGFPLDIIGFYGMQRALVKNNELIILAHYMQPINELEITSLIAKLRSELGFTTYVGEAVEIHESGMITFPLLGTTAASEKKLRFDPERKKRRACYRKVKDAFSDYTVFIGGTSSFDIVPRPYNKLYALNAYVEAEGIDRERVVYLGDDYGTAGNDEHVYRSDFKFICVDNYLDFPQIAEDLLLGEMK